jgi:hypothetical protein
MSAQVNPRRADQQHQQTAYGKEHPAQQTRPDQHQCEERQETEENDVMDRVARRKAVVARLTEDGHEIARRPGPGDPLFASCLGEVTRGGHQAERDSLAAGSAGVQQKAGGDHQAGSNGHVVSQERHGAHERLKARRPGRRLDAARYGKVPPEVRHPFQPDGAAEHCKQSQWNTNAQAREITTHPHRLRCVP